MKEQFPDVDKFPKDAFCKKGVTKRKKKGPLSKKVKKKNIKTTGKIEL